MRASSWLWISVLGLGLASLHAQDSKGDWSQTLDATLKGWVEAGAIVGAQVAVYQEEAYVISRGYGTQALGSEVPVDDETLFLIASCSKPFAAFCVLALTEDTEAAITLDDKIDRWLPAYKAPKLRNGILAKRPPTVAELLSHRAGIYSQKRGMTAEQTRWIRKFDHELETAVDAMARYPLLYQPGEDYGYSGAGYCVLGRVAELAAGESFEVILQKRVCGPIELKHTTYFPAARSPLPDIATGRMAELAPHQLGEKHRFPLIGGSLYSTAEEMSLFAASVAKAWKGADEVLGISAETIQETSKRRGPPNGYGLGWLVRMEDGNPVMLSHSGSLQGYRAWIAVNLEGGTSLAACWTLGPNANPPVIPLLQETLSAVPY